MDKTALYDLDADSYKVLVELSSDNGPGVTFTPRFLMEVKLLIANGCVEWVYSGCQIVRANIAPVGWQIIDKYQKNRSDHERDTSCNRGRIR